MAVAHIDFNHSTPHGNLLFSALQDLERGFERLNDVLATHALMIDGDGSSSAHHAYATTKFGYVSDAVAKAGYDELASLAFKLNTNASVSDVNAAMLQAFNKFR